MTEQELYDVLTAYYWEHQGEEVPESDKVNLTFMLTAVAETKDTLTAGSAIIDPDMPAQIKGPPIDQNMAQQTLIYFNQLSEKALKQARDMAQALHQACVLVGKEKLLKLVDSSNSAEEFGDKLRQYLMAKKKKPDESVYEWNLHFSSNKD